MRQVFPLFCRVINEEQFGFNTNLRMAFQKLEGDDVCWEIFVSVSVIVVHLFAVHHGQNRRAWHVGHI